MIDSTWRSK